MSGSRTQTPKISIKSFTKILPIFLNMLTNFFVRHICGWRNGSEIFITIQEILLESLELYIVNISFIRYQRMSFIKIQFVTYITFNLFCIICQNRQTHAKKFCMIITLIFVCAKLSLLDFIKSYLSLVHCIIVWFYYHLLLTKNYFILSKTYFYIFGYSSKKREAFEKNGNSRNFFLTVHFNFHKFSGLEKTF